MKRLAPPLVGLVSALVLMSAGPAYATGGLSCESADGASIDLVLGRLAVLAVVDATIAVGDERWVTRTDLDEDNIITVGQAFSDNGVMAVDFTDEIVNDIVARLRLFVIDSGVEPVIGGTLEVEGTGAWVVSCMETG